MPAAFFLGVLWRGREEDAGHALDDVVERGLRIRVVNEERLVQRKELLRAEDGQPLVQQHGRLGEVGEAHSPEGAHSGVAMGDKGNHLLVMLR